MRDEVVRLRDELRAEGAKAQQWQIASAAANVSCSRACRDRDDATRRVVVLETALSSILCAVETVRLGDPGGELGNVLVGVSRTAAEALRLYDPDAGHLNTPEKE